MEKNENNKVFNNEDLFNEVIATLKANGVKDNNLPTKEQFEKKCNTSTQVGTLPINTKITLTGEITIEVTAGNPWYGAKTQDGNVISLKNILPLRLGDVNFSETAEDVCWKTKETPTDEKGNKLEETPIKVTLKAEKSADWKAADYSAITDADDKILGEINPQQLYIAIKNGKYNLTNVILCLKARGVRKSTARKCYKFGDNFVRIGDARATIVPVWQNVIENL